MKYVAWIQNLEMQVGLIGDWQTAKLLSGDSRKKWQHSSLRLLQVREQTVSEPPIFKIFCVVLA